MNYWAMAFPTLIFFTSFGTCRVIRKPMVMLSANATDIAMGIVLIYSQTSRPDSSTWGPGTSESNIGITYFSISVSLNVLLTLMIVVRLVLHSRVVRGAMGPLVRPSGLYNAVVSMLIESSALYAVNFLLFIGAWGTKSPAQFTLFPILAQTQVRNILTFSKVPESVI